MQFYLKVGVVADAFMDVKRFFSKILPFPVDKGTDKTVSRTAFARIGEHSCSLGSVEK
jgi:hypothetical protein